MEPRGPDSTCTHAHTLGQCLSQRVYTARAQPLRTCGSQLENDCFLLV